MADMDPLLTVPGSLILSAFDLEEPKKVTPASFTDFSDRDQVVVVGKRDHSLGAGPACDVGQHPAGEHLDQPGQHFGLAVDRVDLHASPCVYLMRHLLMRTFLGR